ncbi:MAG: T9SS type A sorting domain-containing protein [Crocinitomicaceae bacterium]|nr:T9SS type A sorting domain-containing protein [Crocinitomicaceae bacterium]
MKTSILLALFIAISSFSFGQHPSCDGTRYLNPVYSVTQTDGILFGNNDTYDGSNQDLLLDFFEPTGDVAASRPLIIFAFGGSFIGGARDDVHAYCDYYAQRGYACAAIDYRLYNGPLFPIPDSLKMTDAVVKALGDMKAAIRFFKEDAATTNTYKIDPNFIIAGGISAGGIVALHAGMLDETDPIEAYVDPIIVDNGGFQGNSSSNTQYDEDILAVLNYSGALRRANYIDASDVPVFSVHDDNDGTVPYASGSASLLGIPIISMEGSFIVNQNAQAAGLTSELITYDNSSGHVSYFSDQTAADSILQRSLEFLFPLICGAGASVETIVPNMDFELYPNPAQSSVTIKLANANGFELSMSDISGRKVISTTAQTGSTVISLEGFTPGVYFVEVVNEESGIRERKQLVVN